ncbi:MAG: phenylalanine--tRNA ligase subunit alpha [Fimbriimonadaceae bacterium]|nr:phenylalanine--tRNA ligase subunit alpha [Fimbriimonadaceae bacterium]
MANTSYQELSETLTRLEGEVAVGIARSTTTAELGAAFLPYMGKSGSLTGLMKGIGALSPEERPRFGAQVNEAKARIQALHDQKALTLKAAERAVQFQDEAIDITLPGRPPRMGQEHILNQTVRKIKRVLGSMGFVYAEGPELEQFKYNFDELNYPPDHPAMDAQDTFYITDDLILRTQGTALQGRVYETVKPPLRYFTVARTFRNEAVDRTHGHTFHQVDCFMVDEGVSMAHLKGTLGAFASAMFGDEAKVRFRPDFFPFVEPGVDYAVSTPKLFGGRWVELGGAGMVHPNILERHGIDPERYSGFAFGLGVERIPMMAHGVDDLRNFMDNDIRFLEQFP